MAYEVGVIAHSCGVKEPRQLNRSHAQVVLDKGLSVPLSELHPNVKSGAQQDIQPLKIRAES